MNKPVIEEGDIIHIKESAGKRYTGYGVVTAKVGSDLVSFKRLVDRHGGAVNLGVKKVAAITINYCYCTVLDEEQINKLHEASIARADLIREHMLSNRKR